MKISIITVCYNESPARIAYTLDSIIGQDYRLKECIIVDGGSQDQTISALEAYSGAIDVLVSEPDRGLYDAMNKGISLAQGDYILFMNIGDRFHSSSVLSSLVAVNQQAPSCEILYGDALVCGAKETLSKAPGVLNRQWLYQRAVCHQAMLVSRKCYARLGGFDLTYSRLADRDWLLRALSAGASYTYVPITVCDFELAVSVNWKRQRRELAFLHHRYFTPMERVRFGIVWFIRKLVVRIRAGNYAVPIAWRFGQEQSS